MRVLSRVLRPALRNNAISQAHRSALQQPAAKKESAVASFEHRKPEDYGAKKLTPTQKQAVALRERIAKIQNDTKMDPEQKAALLKTLNAQLAQLQQKMQSENSKTKS